VFCTAPVSAELHLPAAQREESVHSGSRCCALLMICDAHSVLGLLHRLDMGDGADVSEVRTMYLRVSCDSQSKRLYFPELHYSLALCSGDVMFPVRYGLDLYITEMNCLCSRETLQMLPGNVVLKMF
jgi:hypothetical protein